MGRHTDKRAHTNTLTRDAIRNKSAAPTTRTMRIGREWALFALGKTSEFSLITQITSLLDTHMIMLYVLGTSRWSIYCTNLSLSHSLSCTLTICFLLCLFRYFLSFQENKYTKSNMHTFPLHTSERSEQSCESGKNEPVNSRKREKSHVLLSRETV